MANPLAARHDGDNDGHTPKMRQLRESLEEWKKTIPTDLARDTDVELARMPQMLLIEYNAALLLILRPLIKKCQPGSSVLRDCANANAEICKLYKEIHSRAPLSFPLWALHHVFLSGVT